MGETVEERLVQLFLNNLAVRRGFKQVWNELDSEVRLDLQSDLTELVKLELARTDAQNMPLQSESEPQDRLVRELRDHADPASVVDAAKVGRPWTERSKQYGVEPGFYRHALGGQQIGHVYKAAREADSVRWKALVLGGWVDGWAKDETEGRARIDALLGLDGWKLQEPPTAETPTITALTTVGQDFWNKLDAADPAQEG